MAKKHPPSLVRVLKAFKKQNLEVRAQAAGGFMAQCPAHLDSNPSLSVQWKKASEQYGSGVVFNCFAQQCSSDDIVRELGLTLADLFDVRPGEEEEPAEAGPKVNGTRWANFHEVWDTVELTPDWLAFPFVERGRATSIYSPPASGKSLIALEIAAAIAAGRDVLGQPVKRAKVVYWDMENDMALWVGRLKKMNFSPDDLHDHLFYYSYPDSPGGLDTVKGGADLVAEAMTHDAVLVVVDTYASTVEGDEDKADTVRAFVRNLVSPLKRSGIAILRLDHTGWSEAHERGSSAKRGDVDYAWQMSRQDDNHSFKFTNKKDRTGFAPEDDVIVIRTDDPWLHHQIADDMLSGLTDPVDKLIEAMDKAGLPNDASNRAARAAGIKGKNEHIAEAIKRRKARDDGDSPQG